VRYCFDSNNSVKLLVKYGRSNSLHISLYSLSSHYPNLNSRGLPRLISPLRWLWSPRWHRPRMRTSSTSSWAGSSSNWSPAPTSAPLVRWDDDTLTANTTALAFWGEVSRGAAARRTGLLVRRPEQACWVVGGRERFFFRGDASLVLGGIREIFLGGDGCGGCCREDFLRGMKVVGPTIYSSHFMDAGWGCAGDSLKNS
jgi:hypothetical protein